ncbi:unnamed protein product [Adineta steineri]|uniref:Uncharacterized protein n=1 Tax=Adineta steineri TaxID=433720 RepID=A0A818QC43_9BILA|nr:unnamed protein product [Adineta steineri]CAF3632589.1 unnamed protein product [Adineta steineri]
MFWYNETLVDYVELISEYSYYFAATPSCYAHLKCNRGSAELCLDWREICDGKEDCLDGEDEEQCWQLETSICHINEYQCNNRECIPIEFSNDDPLNPDCSDGTDERESDYTSSDCGRDLAFRCEEALCRPKRSEPQLFSCGDGQCVEKYDQCRNDRYKHVKYPKYGETLPRCIAKSRLLDGIKDCPLNDDETYADSCLLDDIEMRRFRCRNGKRCPSRRLLNDKIHDCSDISDEIPPIDRYLENHLVFEVLCDGIENMISVVINGQKHSDETNCEEWPCNNSLTRCNSLWNCPKGEDELECANSPINCPPNHHPCISPKTHELICLSIGKVNDNSMDCLGGSDEREFCRLKYPHDKELRYRCWNSTYCMFPTVPQLCQTPLDIELEQIIWSKPVIPLFNSPLTKHLERLIDTRNIQSVDKGHDHLQIDAPQLNIRHLSQMGSRSSLYPLSSRNHSCRRGLMIRTVWKNDSIWRCMCPPSTYGNSCQYQSQRVALVVEESLLKSIHLDAYERIKRGNARVNKTKGATNKC